MPNYRRYFVPGGSFFFTLTTLFRRPFLVDALARTCLRQAIETVQEKFPFSMDAVVLLPDHLHALWTLPAGDVDYPLRWRKIKSEFTKQFLAAGGKEARRSPSRVKRKERGVWQRRFWEHMIRDIDDFKAHLDYVHYNPVKHGYVARPLDWPYSTLKKWIDLGEYAENWGNDPNELQIPDLDAGE